jgi:hypothetical protein
MGGAERDMLTLQQHFNIAFFWGKTIRGPQRSKGCMASIIKEVQSHFPMPSRSANAFFCGTGRCGCMLMKTSTLHVAG